MKVNLWLLDFYCLVATDRPVVRQFFRRNSVSVSGEEHDMTTLMRWYLSPPVLLSGLLSLKFVKNKMLKARQ